MAHTKLGYDCVLIVILHVMCVVESLAVNVGNITYEFGRDCNVSLERVTEDLQIFVEYHGKSVKFSCAEFSFQGEGKEIADEYEFCVTPEYFRDPKCAVRLDYKSSDGSGSLRSVTCADNFDSIYCGSQGENLYIRIQARNGKSTTDARFRLLIKIRKPLDFGGLIALVIVSCLIGSLIVISLLIGLLCWCVSRRKPTQGRVFNRNQANQTNLAVYPYAQSTGNNYSAFPTTNYPTQPATGYSTPPTFLSSQTTGPQQIEKQASAPPPCYDEVIS
ncbi:uncharacterized protein LOC125656144 [Ostrea edulis]|uniref:uncharacterized protein LOC125656144 n=1 Tax=Ostrea edulis TaxID=37623 RepID=UPI00209514C3|nr:uncharacterized protein LOC125656144 [Ostrea edulis]